MDERDTYTMRYDDSRFLERRVLTTVLFSDIVGSTDKVLELGDRGWSDFVERHHADFRELLTTFDGREVDVAGDGFLATFPTATLGIACALTIRERARELGIELRAGMHTGECELDGNRVRGIAVHTGARIAALASSGEILVSGTVRDVAAGSAFRFEDRGLHELRGIPGARRLFAPLWPERTDGRSVASGQLRRRAAGVTRSRSGRVDVAK